MYIYICDGDYITDVIIKIDGEYRTAHMKHRETVPSRHNNLVCVCVCVLFLLAPSSFCHCRLTRCQCRRAGQRASCAASDGRKNGRGEKHC